MKKLFFMCVTLLLTVSVATGQDKLSLKDIASGNFAAEVLTGVNPLADGESYSIISKDGTKVVKYSYKTGKQTGILFDVNKTVGEKLDGFDGYIMSPDETKMLIRTNTKKILRKKL